MKNIFLMAIIATALIFSGCASRVVVRDRPAPPVVVRPAAPRPGYVWVEGGYVRAGRGYSYRPGYWVAPRRPGAVYKQGYWRQSRRGYVWVPGRW